MTTGWRSRPQGPAEAGPRDLTFVWRGVEEWLAEHASIELGEHGVVATGVQLGAAPQPYRIDYELDAREGWITRRLAVRASCGDGERSLVLEHDGRGTWAVDGQHAAVLDGALDCDIAFSPVTNLMPIRRTGLHERAGAQDFAMAWVSVPDLRVHRSPQRYEHVAPGIVRYVALDGDFRAELELDADGLVVRYPRLAERVGEGTRVDVGQAGSVGVEPATPGSRFLAAEGGLAGSIVLGDDVEFTDAEVDALLDDE